MTDPLPPSPDPYAPPLARRLAPAPEELGGYWSDGKRLVLHREARLPDRCLRCNAPATVRLRKALYWHRPALYLLILLHLLIYAIVALIVRKKLESEWPLCDRHAGRRRWGIALAWFGFLGLFLFPLLSIQAGRALGPSETWTVVAVLSVPLALVLLFVGLFLQTIVRPTKIDETHGYFVVGKPFLASCPPLP